MHDITFITGNPDKLRELQRYLSIPLKHHSLDLTEIQSLDPREIIDHKTKEAYRILQNPVLVEDTSLIFHTLGRLPGTYIKWFLKELGNDGLCKMLHGYDDRSATARIIYGLYDGTTLHTFEGDAQGSIALSPQVEDFGWNPIFIPEGFTQTWGEMSKEEKDKTSMRKIALDKLEVFLTK